MTVACEPTGHRWRGLGQLAVERGMSFVCVQPMLSSLARKGENLTSDKTDDKDAVLIARLTAQLRCYLPEPVDPVWGRLRHLGARREQLLETHIRCVQQIRDLLECVWPAVLDAAAQPFKSMTWVAAVSVVVARDDGNLARTRRRGVRGCQDARSGLPDGLRVAVVDVRRGVHRDPGMSVLVVVPAVEAGAERAGVLNGAEGGWEVGPVLQGLERRLGVGVDAPMFCQAAGARFLRWSAGLLLTGVMGRAR